MKLLIVVAVLIAGHMAKPLDPHYLAFDDHIQKDGKLIPGAYQAIDDTVGDKLNKFMTSKGLEISQQYIPLYEKFDECLENNNAACIQQMFEKFHKLDKGLTANIKNPAIKAAYAKFTENMFKAGEQAAKSTRKTGEVDIVKLDEEHKEINDELYRQLF